jgi:hypothetical protein
MAKNTMAPFDQEDEPVYVIRPARFRVLDDGTQVLDPDRPSRSARMAVDYAVQQVYFAARRFTRAFELDSSAGNSGHALGKLVDTIVDWQDADEALEKLRLVEGATEPADSRT